MNERIKDLLEEAGFVSYGEDTGFYNIPAPAFLSRIDRFAELIVRECGVALSPMLRDMVSRGQAFDLIKQHFGVEE
jgi:hypothetical protein